MSPLWGYACNNCTVSIPTTIYTKSRFAAAVDKFRVQLPCSISFFQQLLRKLSTIIFSHATKTSFISLNLTSSEKGLAAYNTILQLQSTTIFKDWKSRVVCCFSYHTTLLIHLLANNRFSCISLISNLFFFKNSSTFRSRNNCLRWIQYSVTW